MALMARPTATRGNLPMIDIIQATKYESPDIQTMHMSRVSGYQFLYRYSLQSGIVMRSRTLIGQLVIHSSQTVHFWPYGRLHKPHSAAAQAKGIRIRVVKRDF